MSRPLALKLESLQVDLRKGLPSAARLGAKGLSFQPVGPLAPEALSATGRREIRHLYATHQLELPALFCPLRRGLAEPEGLDRRLERLRDAITLACALHSRGTGLVTLAVGPVPEDSNSPAWQRLRQAVGDLAASANRVGGKLALVAGAEPLPRLLAFVEHFQQLGCVGVAINPSTLLQQRHDPVEALFQARSNLYLLVAQDFRYGSVSRLALPSMIGSIEEVSLGAGFVDWLGIAGALHGIQYDGWVVIDRGPTPDPQAEAAKALAFLRGLGM